MKRKITLAVSIIIIVAACAYFYFLKPKEAIEINKILENPNEYSTPAYLRSLSIEQRTRLIDDFNNLLYENCKDGKLNENCTPYLVYSYLRTRLTIAEFEVFPDPEKEFRNMDKVVLNNTIPNIYLNSLKDLPTLTEDDLKGFVVPLLTKMCMLRFSNGTHLIPTWWFPYGEKIDWAKKIIYINKTNWHSTDMQIYYLVNCINARTVNESSQKLNISLDELSNRICNILPTFSNINQEDLCEIFDYLKIKRFCLINITADERTLIENLLSKDYESNYQKDCKWKLLRLYNLM